MTTRETLSKFCYSLAATFISWFMLTDVLGWQWDIAITIVGVLLIAVQVAAVFYPTTVSQYPSAVRARLNR